MSDPTPPTEPYQSPAYFADRDVPDAVMVPRRPGGLTAICVIAIILGVLGLITGLMGIVGAVAGQAMQNAVAPSMPQNLDDEALKVQKEMNEAMQAVGQRFIVPNIVFISIALCVATCLIVGGAKSLKFKQTGRLTLMVVFVLAIFFELARGVFQLYVQMQIMVVMTEYWPRLMETAAGQQAPGAPDLKTVMDIAMTAAKVMAYGATILPVLVKGGFYATGTIYLGRRKVKQLFEQSAAEESPFGLAEPKI